MDKAYKYDEYPQLEEVKPEPKKTDHQKMMDVIHKINLKLDKIKKGK